MEAPFELETKVGVIKRLIVSITIGDKLGYITMIFVEPVPIEFI